MAVGSLAVVSFVVDSQGQVSEVAVVNSSSSRFHAAVLAVVPHWRFSPGLRHGQAVAVRCLTRLNFTLAD